MRSTSKNSKRRQRKLAALSSAQCLLLFSLLGSLQCIGIKGANQTASDKSLPTGEIIGRVVCTQNTEQSYALFLPKDYAPGRKWPVLFAFDPLGRGKLAVTLAQPAAEKFGYIVAASNNSRNGPIAAQRQAAATMLLDVANRFSVDDSRFYATGFSGGARVATAVAMICKTCIAGVIAQGAGFPTGMPPDAEVQFGYFSTAGELDFNYPELRQLSYTLDRLRKPNRFRHFVGTHDWAPPELWLEAFAWMELRAMQEGRREKDVALISKVSSDAAVRAKSLEAASDLYGAWEEYNKSAELLAGLTDVSAFSRRAAELQGSPAIEKARKNEVEEFRQQERLADKLISELGAVDSDPGSALSLREQIEREYAYLRVLSESKKTTPEVKPAQRALRQVQGFAFDSGFVALSKGSFAKAETYFQLLAEMAPDRPGPLIQLARVHLATGHQKQAFHELQRAVDKGLHDPKVLDDMPEFATIREDPKYKSLVQKMLLEAQRSSALDSHK